MIMPSRRHHIDHALRLAIPPLEEFFDLFQWTICTPTQHDHAYHTFAGARLVAHKLHPVPIPILRLTQPGKIKSAEPGGNALPVPEIDGLPVAESVIPYRHG